jgi:IrrE N-terminal-like domain
MRHWPTKDIRALAFKRILAPLRHRRAEFAPGAGISPLELLPIRPDRIITELVRLKLEEPEEIVPDMGMSPNSGSQIAGVLDRRLERIVAAAKFPWECRRFTMLHELGHYFLHPDLVYHRDIPLVGSERSEVRRRSRVEIEADIFAAEVLMPRRLLADLFMARYRRTISPDEVDEDLTFRLSMGANRRISIDEFIHSTRRGRSRIIAKDNHAGPSFVEMFLASREAVAIRLEELGLVL